jgi:hypothetical protein
LSGPYRDAQAVAVARELVVEQRIAAVEAELAALRSHRELLTSLLARETRWRSSSPERKGVLVGAVFALGTLVVLAFGLVLFSMGS